MQKSKLQPKNWQKVKLGEILEKIIDNRGKTPLLSNSGHELIETFQMSINNKYPDLTNKSKQKYVSKKTYNNWFRSGHPKEGDILFSTVGASIPQWCFVPKNSKYCIAQNLIALRPDGSKVLPEYLKSYFDQKKFVKEVKGIIIGAAQPSIKVPHLLSLKISLPSLNDQKRIAGILSAFNDKIELNNKISKNLEQMAQAIFKEWFVKFNFPGHEKVKMVDSELGKIPEEWKAKKIGSIANVILGGTPSRANSEYWGGSVPWINSGKVNEFRITSASEYITKIGLERSNARLMPRRTIVIAITGATLGQVSLLEIEASANQSVVGIFGSNVVSPEFLYLYTKQNINRIIQAAGGGAQQHINKQIVAEYPILIPCKKTLFPFTNTVQPIFNKIANLVLENQKLASLRDLLLPKLMSGEIRV